MAKKQSALQQAEEARKAKEAEKRAQPLPTEAPADPITGEPADPITGEPTVSDPPPQDGPEGYSDPKAQELAQQLAVVSRELTEARAQLAAKAEADDGGLKAKVEELSRRNADLEKQLKDSHSRAGQYPARMEDMPSTDQIPKVVE